MRKSTKALFLLGAAIATPLIANHVISKKAAARTGTRECESLYNWEYGDIKYITAGEGPPMLLLHGLYPGAGALEFKKVVDEFARDYKVYVPDMLGFGYSDKPNISYCSYLYVRLIKDFIEDVIGAPVVAAASLHTAAALATCAKFNPEDFSKIFLISPTGTTEDANMPTDIEGYSKKAFDAPVFGSTFYHALTSKKAMSRLFEMEGLVNENFDEQTLDEFYLSAHAGGVGGKYAMAALISKFFNTDIKQILEELTIPYKIITGADAPQACKMVPFTGIGDDVAVHQVANARLLPHLDNPAEFYSLIKELL